MTSNACLISQRNNILKLRTSCYNNRNKSRLFWITYRNKGSLKIRTRQTSGLIFISVLANTELLSPWIDLTIHSRTFYSCWLFVNGILQDSIWIFLVLNFDGFCVVLFVFSPKKHFSKNLTDFKFRDLNTPWETSENENSNLKQRQRQLW